MSAHHEITGAADDMTASSGHRDTVVRAGGQLDDGVHDFDIPLAQNTQGGGG